MGRKTLNIGNSTLGIELPGEQGFYVLSVDENGNQTYQIAQVTEPGEFIPGALFEQGKVNEFVFPTSVTGADGELINAYIHYGSGFSWANTSGADITIIYDTISENINATPPIPGVGEVLVPTDTDNSLTFTWSDGETALFRDANLRLTSVVVNGEETLQFNQRFELQVIDETPPALYEFGYIEGYDVIDGGTYNKVVQLYIKWWRRSHCWINRRINILIYKWNIYKH